MKDHLASTGFNLLPDSITETSFVLPLLNFILTEFIESQFAFFQEKKYFLFDPHPTESCCQIRSLISLLCSRESLKTPLELQYQIDYLKRMKNKVNTTTSLSILTESNDLTAFLKKHELIILINDTDQFIFVTYFLTKANQQKINTSKIDATALQTLTTYYEKIITPLSSCILNRIAANMADHQKSTESLKLAKKEAESANRAKTEFLENMRHDIRTPLTGIIGFSRLIQQEATNPKMKEYADNLMQATSALLDFQNEILDMIKVSQNAEPKVIETFHLKNQVQRILDLIRPKAIIKNLSLSLHYDNNLPLFFQGDAKRLFRIILELMTNALKFTAAGEIGIYLSAEKNDKEKVLLRCEIKDTGIGIPDDKKESIFVRFHRLSPSSDGVYEGTGLGLTIVKKFVKEMGGKMVVESQVGWGSSFICFIPLLCSDSVMDKNELIHIKQNQTPILFQHPTILLIEDHKMIATVTQLLLTELGCEVTVAHDAASALKKASEKNYGMILMDLGLPDSDGFELAKKIRLINKNDAEQINIVALTAHKEEGDEKRLFSAGMDAIFQKPLLRETAIHLLNQYAACDNMKIVDLTLGAKRLNKDTATAKSMIDLLLKHIDDDKKNIEHALEKKDWKTLRETNHRLLGVLAYCGVPRLESACFALQRALKGAEVINYERVVQTLLDEINKLREVEVLE